MIEIETIQNAPFTAAFFVSVILRAVSVGTRKRPWNSSATMLTFTALVIYVVSVVFVTSGLQHHAQRGTLRTR